MVTIYPSGNKSSTVLHTENVALFVRPPVNAAEEKIMWVVHEHLSVKNIIHQYNFTYLVLVHIIQIYQKQNCT